MKKLICLLVSCFGAIAVQAQPTHADTIQLGPYTLTCDSGKGGSWCHLPEGSPLYSKLYAMVPNVQVEDKWEWLQKYLTYRMKEEIIDVMDIACPQNTGLSIKRFLALWNGGAHEGYAILSGNDMIAYFQSYSDIRNLPKESIFTKEVIEKDLCSNRFTHSDFALFGKWFDCNKIEDIKNEYSTTTRFECKLAEQEPQYKTLFGQTSYLSTARLFPHPQKALRKMLKGKELGCATHQFFSCPQKDVAVGVCSGQEGETFMQMTPYGIFTLTNTDLKNSIADKEHANELCNLTWDNFML